MPKTENSVSIFCAITFIILGILIIKKPIWYSSQFFMNIDLTNYKWTIGLTLISLGSIILWYKKTKQFKRKC